MKYTPPIGGAANDPYVDGDPSTGVEGSAVAAAAIEDPMRELVALISDTGLTPDDADLTQVAKAVRMSIQRMASAVSDASGTADAITAAFTPAIVALTKGMKLYVRAGAKNTSATPTFTPNSSSIAAKTIVKGDGRSLIAGDIAGPGHWLELEYDQVLDKWVLADPASGVISSVGVGQTFQSLVGSRSLGTTYYNTTGNPILVSVSAYHSSVNSGTITFTINGVSCSGNSSYSVNEIQNVTFIVPVGGSYSATWNIAGGALNNWCELR